MTNKTHVKIFTENTTVKGFDGSELFPLFGHGQYRSVGALERKGYGKVVSSSLHPYHTASYFFKFEEGYRFNWITQVIEKA